MGGTGKTKYAVVFSFLWLLLWKYVELIGLKAPDNYSDQFGSNKISVLFCEGPKPNMSILSGFLNPGGPLFMDLHLQNTSKHIREIGNMFEPLMFVNLRIYNFYFVGKSVYQTFSSI